MEKGNLRQLIKMSHRPSKGRMQPTEINNLIW